MNRRIIPLRIFSVLCVLSFLVVIAIPYASADFYVIAGGSRGVGTEIKSLPYTISSPGFYYITKDLTCAAGVHGITITADNVTLDLMGFSLVGPGDTGIYDGIYMYGRSNVEIRNGTIRDFQNHAIFEQGTGGKVHQITNICAKDNGYSGIWLQGRGHIVERCTAVGHSVSGIWIDAGSTVTGNICYQNDQGGISASAGGATISGNTCYDNGRGIYAGIGSTVTGNTCYDNANRGISLEGENLVDQNTAVNNGTNMNACENCVFGTNVGAPVP